MKSVQCVSKAEPHRWLAPPGLMLDLEHPQSPTNLAETMFNVSKRGRHTRSEGMQDADIWYHSEYYGHHMSCGIKRHGVMADSGANAYMVDYETYLVGCHNI